MDLARRATRDKKRPAHTSLGAVSDTDTDTDPHARTHTRARGCGIDASTLHPRRDGTGWDAADDNLGRRQLRT
ncbi:hypothetical protein FI667_g16613, partial [Globisporangium splendens]